MPKEEIDEPEQPIKALDEGDIALLKTYVSIDLISCAGGYVITF